MATRSTGGHPDELTGGDGIDVDVIDVDHTIAEEHTDRSPGVAT